MRGDDLHLPLGEGVGLVGSLQVELAEPQEELLGLHAVGEKESERERRKRRLAGRCQGVKRAKGNLIFSLEFKSLFPSII